MSADSRRNAVLSAIAPRLARAVADHRVHEMRGIRRCSCGYGWRVIGHEYDTGGCMTLRGAKASRDRFEARDA